MEWRKGLFGLAERECKPPPQSSPYAAALGGTRKVIGRMGRRELVARIGSGCGRVSGVGRTRIQTPSSILPLRRQSLWNSLGYRAHGEAGTGGSHWLGLQARSGGTVERRTSTNRLAHAGLPLVPRGKFFDPHPAFPLPLVPRGKGRVSLASLCPLLVHCGGCSYGTGGTWGTCV